VTRQNDGGAASNGGGRETREREELLFFSPILLFFCSFLLFSPQLKSSPLCSSTLFSKQSLFLSQTIPCFILSIRFSSSSSFPKSFAPSVFFFFFSFFPVSAACFLLFSKKNFSSSAPPSFSLYLSVFIASGSESDDALSCHGAGRGGVRQLCTVDPATAWHDSLLLLAW